MKNNRYTINGLYLIVRRFYLDSFPNPISFDALDALNFEIKKINKKAKVDEINKVYFFDNPSPTVVDPSNPFSNASEQKSEEEYFEKAGDGAIRNLIQDIRALESWLWKAGYIDDKIATEKMLANKSIV
ncbi:hypothetical protein [Pantoea allii]|uniref:hypothetical protein n=1 Tax=Pantoea allii TaxID=574096 RepID=UPI003D7A8383